MGFVASALPFKIVRFETFDWNLSLGIFAWELSLYSFRPGSFVWIRPLWNVRVGTFDLEFALRNVRLEAFAWTFFLETFAWGRSFGNFGMASLAVDLLLGIFRLGTYV